MPLANGIIGGSALLCSAPHICFLLVCLTRQAGLAGKASIDQAAEQPLPPPTEGRVDAQEERGYGVNKRGEESKINNNS
ncbi:hypothetical protein LY76DRAFT_589122 [Colletotrichum caudatum]|nr:hypothetical protein LY76DRAFT_589122 [Colletotrichum caudatum]